MQQQNPPNLQLQPSVNLNNSVNGGVFGSSQQGFYNSGEK